jgi:uncharacterized membrane protein
MSPARRVVLWLVLAGDVGLPLMAVAQQYQFHKVGTLTNIPNSIAQSVSADGRVVVGFSEGAGQSNRTGFTWTAGGQPQAVNASILYGASQNGSGVVGQTNGRAALHLSGTYFDLGTLPGDSGSIATGVSYDNAVVVGMSRNPGTATDTAVRWTSATGMQPLGSTSSGDRGVHANGCSASGAVVVGSTATQGFRWTQAGGMVGLGRLPGDARSYAAKTSQDGSVVVGYSSGTTDRATVWTEAGGLQALGSLPNYADSVASDVSADGTRSVGYSHRLGAQRAVFWDTQTGAMTDLNDHLAGLGIDTGGLVLEDIRGIAGTSMTDFTMVGVGRYSNGTYEGFVLTPVPEPAGLLAVAACAVGGWCVRRRRRV